MVGWLKTAVWVKIERGATGAAGAAGAATKSDTG